MIRTFDIEFKTRLYLEQFIDSKKGKRVDKLLDYYKELEDKLLQVLLINILQEIQHYSDEKKESFRVYNQNKFEFKENPYTLKALEDSRISANVYILIKSDVHFDKKNQEREKKIKLDSLGRFNSFSIKIDKIFSELTPDLIQLVKLTLESGYRFIREFVKKSILEARNKTVDRLYSHLRSIFPAKVGRQIYLFAVTKKKGVYLIDPLQLQRMEDISKERKTVRDASPLELISDLSTRILNEEDLAVRETVPNDITLQIKQSKTEFDAHNIYEGIGKAELAVYEIDSLVIQPLVIESPVWIEASYPSNIRYKYDVEKKLSNEREAFTRITKENYSLKRIVNKKIHSVGMTKEAMELWGIFWGKFTKAILDI